MNNDFRPCRMQICISANKILNLLRRNLHFAPKSVKAKAYQSCVRPILEYAQTCWSPSSEKLKKDIEKVQHKAAKFVTNTYPKKGKYEEFSVSRLINNLQWETLEKRRNNAKMIMAYKILNNKVIISPSTLPKENNVRLSRKCNEPTVGRKWQLTEPHSNILASGNTFFYLAPKLWNENVTPEQAESPSADAFKSKFDKP